MDTIPDYPTNPEMIATEKTVHLVYLDLVRDLKHWVYNIDSQSWQSKMPNPHSFTSCYSPAISRENDTDLVISWIESNAIGQSLSRDYGDAWTQLRYESNINFGPEFNGYGLTSSTEPNFDKTRLAFCNLDFSYSSRYQLFFTSKAFSQPFGATGLSNLTSPVGVLLSDDRINEVSYTYGVYDRVYGHAMLCAVANTDTTSFIYGRILRGLDSWLTDPLDDCALRYPYVYIFKKDWNYGFLWTRLDTGNTYHIVYNSLENSGKDIGNDTILYSDSNEIIGPFAVQDYENNVHMVWRVNEVTNNKIYYKRWMFKQNEWLADTMLASTPRIFTPKIAFNTKGIYILWPERTGVQYGINMRFLNWLNEKPIISLSKPGKAISKTSISEFSAVSCPAGNTIRVEFELLKPGLPAIEIVSMTGRILYKYYPGKLDEGRKIIKLKMASLASGIYVIRLSAGNQINTTTLVHIK
jgi:hypothetical protein